MNRRRLILTTLGALAGCLGLPKVALAAVDPNLTLTSPKTAAAIEPIVRRGIPSRVIDGKWVGPPSFEELFVPVSGTVDEAIEALVSEPEVPIAELYISVSQEVNEALSRETAVVSKPPPLITIGSLIVANEAEAEAFLKRMADAIRKASQPGSSRPGASY